MLTMGNANTHLHLFAGATALYTTAAVPLLLKREPEPEEPNLIHRSLYALLVFLILLGFPLWAYRNAILQYLPKSFGGTDRAKAATGSEVTTDKELESGAVENPKLEEHEQDGKPS